MVEFFDDWFLNDWFFLMEDFYDWFLGNWLFLVEVFCDWFLPKRLRCLKTCCSLSEILNRSTEADISRPCATSKPPKLV